MLLLLNEKRDMRSARKTVTAPSMPQHETEIEIEIVTETTLQIADLKRIWSVTSRQGRRVMADHVATATTVIDLVADLRGTVAGVVTTDMMTGIVTLSGETESAIGKRMIHMKAAIGQVAEEENGIPPHNESKYLFIHQRVGIPRICVYTTFTYTHKLAQPVFVRADYHMCPIPWHGPYAFDIDFADRIHHTLLLQCH